MLLFEFHRAHLSSAEIKNEWSYTSTPICFHDVDRKKPDPYLTKN